MATVRDLIDYLNEAIEYQNIDENTEIVFVTQPSYPLMSGSLSVLLPDSDNEEGVVQFGIGDCYEYGSKKVYEEGDDL